MTNESKKQSASLPSKGTGIIIEDKVETRGGFYTGYIEPREEEVEYCSKKTTENLSKQDLNMLGLYKLSKKDEEIYKKFVEILKKMDPYDAVRFHISLFTYLNLNINFFYREIC